MDVWRWLTVLGLLSALGGAGLGPPVFPTDLSIRAALGQAAAGATLSVLAAPVEVSVGGAAFADARDGMTLVTGDQVRTMGGGVALLTFFDGSETQITPDSEVRIQQAEVAGGVQINVSQILGTTVDRVQRLTSQSTNFSTDTPAATAVVRGTRYAVTTKCYAARPTPPATRLLTFPRRLSGDANLLADEALYDDGGTLWEVRAWRDPDTNDSFDTYEQIGATFPLVQERLYQEDDGSDWIDREWLDPDSGSTWHTYEDVGVPVGDQLAANTARARVSRLPLAQVQAGCHPVTSVVVIEGRVGTQPKTSGLSPFDVTPGNAGAASEVATAASSLTSQGLQAFDRATSDLRDPNTARSAGQLGSQVADEFASVIVPQGGPSGSSGGPSSHSGLLGGVVVRSATANSGLLGLVVAPQPEVAAVQITPTPSVAPVGRTPTVVQGGPLSPVPTSAPSHANSPSSPNPDAVQGVIGSGGGSLGLPDGSATVSFPAGALAGDTTIRIARTTAPSLANDQQLVSSAVDLTATDRNGPVTAFSTPVQVTLVFSGMQPAGVFFFDGTTATWQPLPSTVDVAAGTVTGATTHFTVFAALTGASTATLAPTITPTLATATSPPSTNTALPSSTPTPTPVPPTAKPTPTQTRTPTPTKTATATPTCDSDHGRRPDKPSTPTATPTPTRCDTDHS